MKKQNPYRVLGLITARGKSKGLPKKNVLPVGGKPLLAWTIEAGLESRSIDRLVLSSDDEEIMKVASEYGCDVPFRRPDHLASDEAGSIQVALHALEILPNYDFVVLLQPTSPQRSAEDIDNAFKLMLSQDASCCVSICATQESPYLMFGMNDGNRLYSLIPEVPKSLRRQDLRPTYRVNGAIYIARTDYLKNTESFFGNECVGYEMPLSRSLDIDDAEDFEFFRLQIESASGSATEEKDQ